LRRSSDGGATWQPVAPRAEALIVGFAASAAATEVVHDVAKPDPRYGVSYDPTKDAFLLYVTRDAGVTWRERDLNQ
jgi:uncharacterized protein YigE (DUF2233 family)